MAKSQKQKSVSELHSSAKLLGINNILEISSKSLDELGILLSAFNLSFVTKKHNHKITVESAFQGSKIFKRGGPYKDLYLADSRTSKKDIRIKDSGQLVGFKFFNTSPPTPANTESKNQKTTQRRRRRKQTNTTTNEAVSNNIQNNEVLEKPPQSPTPQNNQSKEEQEDGE